MSAVLFEILLLVTALSVDAFAAGFVYGVNKIKIPFLSLLIVTAISSALLALSLLLGSLAGSVLSDGFARILGFLLLSGLGLWKLQERAGEEGAEGADRNGDQLLSPGESLTLGLGLSADSLAAGIGAGAFACPIPAAFAASFFMGAAALLMGKRLGGYIAVRFRLKLSWLSGALLILLAVVKLL